MCSQGTHPDVVPGEKGTETNKGEWNEKEVEIRYDSGRRGFDGMVCAGEPAVP